MQAYALRVAYLGLESSTQQQKPFSSGTVKEYYKKYQT